MNGAARWRRLPASVSLTGGTCHVARACRLLTPVAAQQLAPRTGRPAAAAPVPVSHSARRTLWPLGQSPVDQRPPTAPAAISGDTAQNCEKTTQFGAPEIRRPHQPELRELPGPPLTQATRHVPAPARGDSAIKTFG